MNLTEAKERNKKLYEVGMAIQHAVQEKYGHISIYDFDGVFIKPEGYSTEHQLGLKVEMTCFGVPYQNESIAEYKQKVFVAAELKYGNKSTADEIQKIALNANSNMDLTDVAAAVKPKQSSLQLQ